VIARKYAWDGLTKDINTFIQDCDICQWFKSYRHGPYGELQPLKIPTAPWHHFSLNFVTDLPESETGGRQYNSILVLVDCFTKLVRYIPCCKTIDAPELAELLAHEWLRTGTPDSLMSD
jgi:hypothetical protein